VREAQVSHIVPDEQKVAVGAAQNGQKIQPG
jgi:hypothetical protein